MCNSDVEGKLHQRKEAVPVLCFSCGKLLEEHFGKLDIGFCGSIALWMVWGGKVVVKTKPFFEALDHLVYEFEAVVALYEF